MEKVRVRVRVEGLVQGVFYRATTQRQARALGLKGWVRNLPDGAVECLAEGEKGDVEELLRWLARGPTGARVDRVTTGWEPYRGDQLEFSIRY